MGQGPFSCAGVFTLHKLETAYVALQEVLMAVPPAQPADENGPFFVREHLVVCCRSSRP